MPKPFDFFIEFERLSKIINFSKAIIREKCEIIIVLLRASGFVNSRAQQAAAMSGFFIVSCNSGLYL